MSLHHACPVSRSGGYAKNLWRGDLGMSFIYGNICIKEVLQVTTFFCRRDPQVISNQVVSPSNRLRAGPREGYEMTAFFLSSRMNVRDLVVASVTTKTTERFLMEHVLSPSISLRTGLAEVFGMTKRVAIHKRTIATLSFHGTRT